MLTKLKISISFYCNFYSTVIFWGFSKACDLLLMSVDQREDTFWKCSELISCFLIWAPLVRTKYFIVLLAIKIGLRVSKI